MAVLTHAHSGSSTKGLFEFTNGLEHDALLYEEEIQVQLAWCSDLKRLEILTAEESQMASCLLYEARTLMKENRFPWVLEDEDIHMNLERFITERAGSLGAKLHQGRSRNDLIATTLRLYAARRFGEFAQSLRDLSSIILSQADENINTLIPGQTHLQFGQPLSVAHILHAYVQGYERAIRMLEANAREALHSLPLGAAALAGTSLPIDGQALCKQLGFQRPCVNSYDSVGDRDFLLMGLDSLSLLMTQLARQCHDVIQWSSTPVGLVRLPKEWSTGSSIMPNMRNPDVPELIRGRAGRAIGRAAGAKTMIHALCTSYASDLHELKKDFLDACLDTLDSLKVMIPFWAGLEFSKERATSMLGAGHILATEVSDLLCQNGYSFRESYMKVGQLVVMASSLGCQVHELERTSLQELELEWLDAELRSVSAVSAVAKRCSQGGSAPERVQAALSDSRMQQREGAGRSQ
jgi:argininosuccinate lyase